MPEPSKLLPAAWDEIEPRKAGKPAASATRRRIKDPRSLREIWGKLLKADEPNAENRSMVQGMLDGALPYDEGERLAAGQDYAANLNFGFGGLVLEQAMANYVDMLSSVDSLVYVYTRYGSATEQIEYNRIIAEEWTRMVRAWDQFDFQTQLLAHYFLKDGVGHAFFDDPYDFRFTAASMDDVKVPRLSRAIESDMEIIVRRREYTAHELFAKVEDPKVAKTAGWNVKAVQKAIMDCSSRHSTWNDWGRIAAELKNNDLYYSLANQATVVLLHALVREMNGKVSLYICREEDQDENQWLCVHEDWYGSASEACVIFPYGLGSNAYYHGIRGLGWKIFPMVQELNKLMSGSLDSAKQSAALMVQPVDENSLGDTPLVAIGGCTVLHPGYKLQSRAFPDLSQSVFPVITALRNHLMDSTGQYTAQSALGGKSERQTRFEVAARLEQAGKLSVTAFNLWYSPGDRLFREMFRRTVSPDLVPGLPGYEEVAEFRRRVAEAGVPEEALYAVDHKRTRAVRAVGAGSQAARVSALYELTEMMSGFDEEGRHNLLRDRVAARIGKDAADRYIPRVPGRRPPIDAKVAELETALLLDGRVIDVAPNDMHDVHANVQVPKMVEVADAVDKGRTDPRQAFAGFQALWEHCSAHVEAMGQDPAIAPQAAALRKTLQQTGEVLYNVAKHLAKMQRQQDGAPPQEGQPQGQGQEEQRAQAEFQMKMQKHQMDMEEAAVRIRGQMAALEARKAAAELEATIKIQKAAADRARDEAKFRIDLNKAL